MGRELPAFFVRLGKSCLLAGKIQDVENQFGKLEQKLREQLKMAELPAPVIQEAQEVARVVSRPQGCVPDEGPTLVFSGDAVIHNMHCEARCRGLRNGSGVSCCFDAQGVPAGTRGVIVDFEEQAVRVLWDNAEFVMAMALDEIALDSEPVSGVAGKAGKKREAAARAAGGDPEAAVAGAAGEDGDKIEGIAWREGSAEDSLSASMWLVAHALNCICKIHGSTHDLLSVLDADKGACLVSKRDIPARGLIILPNPARIQTEEPGVMEDNVVRVQGQFMKDNMTFYLLDPSCN